jgi:hypothetical protein
MWKYSPIKLGREELRAARIFGNKISVKLRQGCISTTCFRSFDKLQFISDRYPDEVPDFFGFSGNTFR